MEAQEQELEPEQANKDKEEEEEEVVLALNHIECEVRLVSLETVEIKFCLKVLKSNKVLKVTSILMELKSMITSILQARTKVGTESKVSSCI